MKFDPSAVSSIVLIISAFIAAFLIALWISAIIWVNRDSRSRSRDPLLIFFSIFFVAVFSLPGILIYLILRPGSTLEENYQSTLEEELLLRSIEDKQICPGCSRPVNADWLACPFCQTPLKVSCEKCGKKIDPTWKLCPFCGTLNNSMEGKELVGTQYEHFTRPSNGIPDDSELPDLTFDL